MASTFPADQPIFLFDKETPLGGYPDIHFDAVRLAQRTGPLEQYLSPTLDDRSSEHTSTGAERTFRIDVCFGGVNKNGDP
jgi:hypothetical protein